MITEGVEMLENNMDDYADQIIFELTGEIIIIVESGRCIVGRYYESGRLTLGIERAQNWQELEREAHAMLTKELERGVSGQVVGESLIVNCPTELANKAIFT